MVEYTEENQGYVTDSTLKEIGMTRDAWIAANPQITAFCGTEDENVTQHYDIKRKLLVCYWCNTARDITEAERKEHNLYHNA